MPDQRRTQMSFMANYLFYGPPLVVESNFQLERRGLGEGVRPLCLFTGCEVFWFACQIIIKLGSPLCNAKIIRRRQLSGVYRARGVYGVCHRSLERVSIVCNCDCTCLGLFMVWWPTFYDYNKLHLIGRCPAARPGDLWSHISENEIPRDGGQIDWVCDAT